MVVGWLVLTTRAGMQDVGMEYLDKSEHAELSESGL